MGSGGAEGLAVAVEAAQTAGAVPHRVMTVEMPAHEDAEPGAGATAGLLGELQGQTVRGHDIVAPDHALVFDAQDVIEVEATERHEGRGGVGGGGGADAVGGGGGGAA